MTGADPRPGILHTIRDLGVNGVVQVLLRNLQHHDHHRFRHYVCSVYRSDALAPEFRAFGVEPFFMEPAGVFDLPRAVRFTSRLVRELGISLIHANRTADLGVAGLAGRLAGIPVVSTIHWLGRPEDHPEDEHLGLTRRWSEMMATVAINRALPSRILAVSEAVRDSYAAVPGFPTGKTDIVYPGIDMHDRSGARSADVAALQASLRIGDAHPVLLNVGRLHEVKGQRHLLPAMRRIRARWPKAVLLIAGGGALEGELAAGIEREGLGDAVRMLGVRRDVDALLTISDALILASESEAAPLPLFEAMRAARPVIATAVGGVLELVDDGVTGLIVPRADSEAIAAAVSRLFEVPGRPEQMGRAARERGLERYDIRVSVARIESVYDRLLGVRAAAEPVDAHAAR